MCSQTCPSFAVFLRRFSRKRPEGCWAANPGEVVQVVVPFRSGVCYLFAPIAEVEGLDCLVLRLLDVEQELDRGSREPKLEQVLVVVRARV